MGVYEEIDIDSLQQKDFREWNVRELIAFQRCLTDLMRDKFCRAGWMTDEEVKDT